MSIELQLGFPPSVDPECRNMVVTTAREVLARFNGGNRPPRIIDMDAPEEIVTIHGMVCGMPYSEATDVLATAILASSGGHHRINLQDDKHGVFLRGSYHPQS